MEYGLIFTVLSIMHNTLYNITCSKFVAHLNINFVSLSMDEGPKLKRQGFFGGQPLL